MNVIDQTIEHLTDMNELDLREAKWAVNGKAYYVSGGLFPDSVLVTNNSVTKPFHGKTLYDITNNPEPAGRVIDEFILRHLIAEEDFVNVISEWWRHIDPTLINGILAALGDWLSYFRRVRRNRGLFSVKTWGKVCQCLGLSAAKPMAAVDVSKDPLISKCLPISASHAHDLSSFGSIVKRCPKASCELSE
jgi:hypothetical protein